MIQSSRAGRVIFNNIPANIKKLGNPGLNFKCELHQSFYFM